MSRHRDSDEDRVLFIYPISPGAALVGASLIAIGNLARNARDRKMQTAVQAMESVAADGRFDRLLTLASNFQVRYPGQLAGLVYRAVAFVRMGRYDEGISAVNKAVERGFDEMQACAIRLEAYEGQRNIPGVLRELSQLVRHSDFTVRRAAVFRRAELLQSIGDFDQALDDANSAIADRPDQVAYYIRGRTFHLMGALGRAVEDYTRADRILPDQEHVLKSRAAAHERLGQFEAAQKDWARLTWLESPTRPENQAREFMAQLNDEGVLLRLSQNQARIVFEGVPMKQEHVPTYERLKTYMLQILRRDLP